MTRTAVIAIVVLTVGVAVIAQNQPAVGVLPHADVIDAFFNRAAAVRAFHTCNPS